MIAFPRAGGSASGFDGGTYVLRWTSPDHDLVGGVLLAALVATPRLWIGDAFQLDLLLGVFTTLLGGFLALFALSILSDRGRRCAWAALLGLVVGAWVVPALIGPAIVLALVTFVWVDLR